MKNFISKNKVLLTIGVAVCVLVVGGSVMASQSFREMVVDKFVEERGDDLMESIILESAEVDIVPISVGASGNIDIALTDSLITTSATYYSRYIAFDSVLSGIELFFDADDGVFNETFQTWTDYCATSTNGFATTTPTANLLISDRATSTGVSYGASSTFANDWQRDLVAGEYLICGYVVDLDDLSVQTPSSTGAIAVDIFNK